MSDKTVPKTSNRSETSSDSSEARSDVREIGSLSLGAARHASDGSMEASDTSTTPDSFEMPEKAFEFKSTVGEDGEKV